MLLHVELVQLRQQIEPRALLLRADARWWFQVDDRIAGRSKQRSLIRGGNEPRAPVVDAAERAAAAVLNHDEARQARVLRTESIGDRGADARVPHTDLAGLHLVR